MLFVLLHPFHPPHHLPSHKHGQLIKHRHTGSDHTPRHKVAVCNVKQLETSFSSHWKRQSPRNILIVFKLSNSNFKPCHQVCCLYCGQSRGCWSVPAVQQQFDYSGNNESMLGSRSHVMLFDCTLISPVIAQMHTKSHTRANGVSWTIVPMNYSGLVVALLQLFWSNITHCKVLWGLTMDVMGCLQ